MNNAQTAFTLVEFLVVTAIIAIIAVIAIPFFYQLLYAMEARRVETIFEGYLSKARTHSFIYKKDVIICNTDSDGACKRDGQNSVVLFYDSNHNNKKDVGDTVLQEEMWGLKYGSIIFRSSAKRDYVRYMADSGKPRGHIGHLAYCSSSSNTQHSFKVIVNMQGGVRIQRGGCA